jgi:APA family basic amino acid/polyamine antiporter
MNRRVKPVEACIEGIWLVAPAAVPGCVYLFMSLPKLAQGRFAVWTVVGAVVYFVHGYRRSPLRS